MALGARPVLVGQWGLVTGMPTALAWPLRLICQERSSAAGPWRRGQSRCLQRFWPRGQLPLQSYQALIPLLPAAMLRRLAATPGTNIAHTPEEGPGCRHPLGPSRSRPCRPASHRRRHDARHGSAGIASAHGRRRCERSTTAVHARRPGASLSELGAAAWLRSGDRPCLWASGRGSHCREQC
jgi:hypothetical protein